MRREKLIKWIVIFFAAMLLFTFLSRAADSVTVAQVQASGVQNQLIVHEVSGNGTIEGTEEQAVFTLEGQKVEQVLVQEGEAVKEGQVLLTVLDSSIQESIDAKQDEIEEKELAVSDLESQKAVEEQKKANEALRAQQDLDTAVGNGDINIANARNELNIARQRLADYRAAKAAAKKAEEQRKKQQNKNEFSGSADFTDGSDLKDETGESTENPYLDSTTEQALADDVRAKQDALNQIIMSRNQEVTAADRARQDAALPTPQDSTGSNLERELENLKEELGQLQTLLQNRGEVKAPADGVVKSLSVSTGGQTTGEAAAVLYKLTGEMRMTGMIQKDDLEYVDAGTEVTLKNSRGLTEENARVLSVQEDASAPGSFIITVSVPEGDFAVGENVDFTVKKENGPYTCCVPLSALYGNPGQQYVFVLDTEDTALGEVQTARKVDVTVKEQNETRAALQEGTLSADQKVITGSDREIEDGSRVRLRDS